MSSDKKDPGAPGFFDKVFDKAVDGIASGPATRLTMKAKLSLGERIDALRYARGLDECLRYGSLKDLFALRFQMATNISQSAPPPTIHEWLRKMVTLIESELKIRAESSLAWLRNDVLAKGLTKLSETQRREALERTRLTRAILGKRAPGIDLELEKTEKLLEAYKPMADETTAGAA